MDENKLDQLIEQASRAELELSRLQKDFLSAAGHEFRTPLTIIDAAARRLNAKAGALGPDEIRLKTAMIRSTVVRMVELVERTFELSRLATNRFAIVPQQVSFRDLIAEVCEKQWLRSPGCEILADLTRCPAEGVGDSRFIDMIAERLIAGCARLIAGAGRIEVGGWRDGDDVILSIKCICELLSSRALDDMEVQMTAYMASENLLDEGMEFKLARFLVEMHRGEIEFHTDQKRTLEIEVILPIDVTASETSTASTAGCQIEISQDE